MNKIIIVIVGIILCLPSISIGQHVDTLIAMAWNNSSKVKALQAEFMAAKTVGNQVNTFPDPEISVGLGVLPVETRLGPQRLRLGVNQMIPWPGLLPAKQALADAMANVKSTDADKYMVEVAFQIKKAYFQLYELNKKISLYEEQLQYLLTLKDLATTRIETGDARLSDVLKIESRILELTGKKEELELSVSIPSYVINRFTFRPLDTPVDQDLDLNLIQPDGAITLKVSVDHPELVRYSKMQEISRQSIELTEYQSKPRIGVGLDYIMVGQRDDSFPDGNGRDIIIPMGKVSIPLNKSSYDYKRQEERLKIEAIDHLKKEFNQQAVLEMESSLNIISQAANSYSWSDKMIENNNAAIELIQTAYSSSEASIEELLDLYVDNIKREISKLNAIIQSHIAQANIEKYQTSMSF